MAEYSDDIRIDPFNLEGEWLEHPGKVFYYNEQLADARREMDEVKRDLDLVAAKINSKIRHNPTNYGLKEKPTKDAVEGALAMEDKYQTAYTEYLDARHEYDVVNAACRAFGDRRSALENLVKLKLSDIHCEPRASVEDKKELDNITSTSVKEEQKERKKMKRRRK